MELVTAREPVKNGVEAAVRGRAQLGVGPAADAPEVVDEPGLVAKQLGVDSEVFSEPRALL